MRDFFGPLKEGHKYLCFSVHFLVIMGPVNFITFTLTDYQEFESIQLKLGLLEVET